MKCLFLIDIQNGFVSDRTKFIIPRIRQLAESFKGDFILATKFINSQNSGFTEIMHWGRLKESPEIDLLPFVKKCADYIIEKNTYTACTDEVLKILSEKNINEVYIAGIDTDCCVLTTAINLFEHNIRPIVLEEYCASNGGENSHNSAITVLKRTIGMQQICFDKLND